MQKINMGITEALAVFRRGVRNAAKNLAKTSEAVLCAVLDACEEQDVATLNLFAAEVEAYLPKYLPQLGAYVLAALDGVTFNGAEFREVDGDKVSLHQHVELATLAAHPWHKPLAKSDKGGQTRPDNYLTDLSRLQDKVAKGIEGKRVTAKGWNKKKAKQLAALLDTLQQDMESIVRGDYGTAEVITEPEAPAENVTNITDKVA